MGNICRSPSAEIIWSQKLQDAGLKGTCDSAGTIGYHQGEPPDARMQGALKQAGYRPFGHSRKVEARDLDRFDWILAMDRENLHALQQLAASSGKSSDHCRLMLEFAGISDVAEVPDPYYGGTAGFDHVVQLLERASDQLIERFQSLANDDASTA